MATSMVAARWKSGGTAQITYTGDFAMGWMHGQGEITTRSGIPYSGAFENDVPNGQGELRWPDGRVYRGELRVAEPHGHGTMSVPGEEDATGIWFEGDCSPLSREESTRD